MHQTARHAAPQPASPDMAELATLVTALTGLCETAARTALTRDEWDYLMAGVLELSGGVRQLGFGVTLTAAERAAERAEGWEDRGAFEAARRPHRHRRGQGQLWPAPVPGSSIAGIAAAAAACWARAHALPAAVVLAAAVTAGAAGMVTLPDVSSIAPPRGSVAAALVPAGAVLISPAAAAPSGAPLAAVPASRPPRTRTRTARAAQSSPPPSSPPPAAGTLDVGQVSVALRETQPGELSGEVDLNAAGGPVSWSASAPGAYLSVYAGTLPAGGVQVVTITVPAPGAGAPAGSAVITFQSGSVPVPVPVTVTWRA
jgi:hypothetical protein